MSAENYVRVARDPDRWFLWSDGLRKAADLLWEQVSNDWHRLPENHDEIFGWLTAACLQYGLAIETTLKGLIVRDYPDQIIFTMETSGDGSVITVKLKSIGAGLVNGKGHNLKSLAQVAGVLPRSADRATTDAVLNWLFECVVWRSRYPVPLESDKVTDGLPEGLDAIEAVEHARKFLADIRPKPKTKRVTQPDAGPMATTGRPAKTDAISIDANTVQELTSMPWRSAPN